MSRRSKRRSSQPGARPTQNVTSMAQQGAALAEAAAGAPLADQDLTVLGLSNINRYFDIQTPGNGPSYVLRLLYPFASFTSGYSSGVIGDQDTGAATNTTLAATDVLNPITPMAEYIESDVWPILTNLFSSGTGVRYNVSISEFVRYNAMLTQAYSYILDIIRMNHLAYHFDWTSVFPFSETVPPSIYDMAVKFDASDVGLASRWLPLMKRFDNKVMFPRIIQAIKRLAQPMQSVDFNGRLMQTFYLNPFEPSIDVDTYYDRIKTLLDYIDVNLADAGAVFVSFLPFPMRMSEPWSLMSSPEVDLDKDAGWWNSNAKGLPIFGDTGDPSNIVALQFEEAENELVYWHTRHTQPIWAEIKWASLWELLEDVVDDEFRLITSHAWSNIIIPDDTDEFFSYDGTAIGTGSFGFRYIDYASCRFASGDVAWGSMKPGFMGSEIGLDPVKRMMRLETQYIFNLEVLKDIVSYMSGASIREIRFIIHQQVVEGIKSEY
jgi:hypothetical protein